MYTVTRATQISRSTQSLSTAPSGTPQLPLAREQITGGLSLLEDHTMTIAAECGTVLRVHRGTLRVGREAERRGHWLVAGARYVAEHDGPVTLSSPEAVELSVEWPHAAGTDFAPRAS